MNRGPRPALLLKLDIRIGRKNLAVILKLS